MEVKNDSNKKEVETEYILSNDDIKYPTFFDTKIVETFKHQKMSKEILIDDLNKIINELKYLIDTIKGLIITDKNNFNTLCINYNINSYDFIIILNLIKELTTVILNKIENNGNPLELTIIEDYFNRNDKDSKIFLSQHKTTDKKFTNITKSANEYIQEIKEIYLSDHECGILFMCHSMKYYLSFVLKLKEQLKNYIDIKDFQNKKNIRNYRKNMIIFFDLIILLKKMMYSNMIITNAFLFNKNDIFNLEEDSEEWKKMKKVLYRVHSKNDDKIKEEFFNRTKKMEATTMYVSKAVKSNLLLSANSFIALLMKFKINPDKNLIIYESKESLLVNEKNIIQEMIKLGKKKIIKVVYEKTYPKIAFREKIYMKRTYPEITLEYIKSLLSKIYGNDIISKNFGDTKQRQKEELDKEKQDKLPLCSKKVIKEDKKYYVSTILLNSYPLKSEKEKVGSSFIKLFKSQSGFSSPKALMIYIHGGGFLNTGFFFP